MAFKSLEDRELAKQMILKNQRTKEIVEALGGACLDSDIYQLRATLRKSGELPAGTKDNTPRKTETPQASRTAKKQRPKLIQLLIDERTRLQARILLFDKIIDTYENELEMPEGLTEA